MDKLTLVRPTLAHKRDALAYKQAHFDAGETVIDGSELLDKMDIYEAWLDRVTKNADPATVQPDWVLTDTYFAVRESDRQIIGIIDFRHELKGFLQDFGHCGYSVRPDERCKGYATEMLKMLCALAQKSGLAQLQLAAEPGNLPSVKTIEKNGGRYVRSFPFGSGQADVYVIDLQK